MTTTNIIEPRHTKIIRNQARCLLCGDMIESKGRHDFVTCSCGSLSVDGGKLYLIRSFQNRLDWEERSIVEEVY